MIIRFISCKFRFFRIFLCYDCQPKFYVASKFLFTGIDLIEREEIRQNARSCQYVNETLDLTLDDGVGSDTSVSSLNHEIKGKGIYDERKSHRPDKAANSTTPKPASSQRSHRGLNSFKFNSQLAV